MYDKKYLLFHICPTRTDLNHFIPQNFPLEQITQIKVHLKGTFAVKESLCIARNNYVYKHWVIMEDN